jgi:hypothetical protein
MLPSAVQSLLLAFTIVAVLDGPIHDGDQRETAVKGTLPLAKTWFSKQVLACAIIGVFQCLVLLLQQLCTAIVYSNCDGYRSPWAHGFSAG